MRNFITHKAFKHPMPQQKHRREHLARFTERAIRMAGQMIPPMIYVPLSMRRKKIRIAREAVTILPPTQAENELRIAQADPVGFLIAIMNGHPIPAFILNEAPDGSITCETVYETPDTATRVTAARALALGKYKGKAEQLEFEQMIKRAGAAFDNEDVVPEPLPDNTEVVFTGDDDHAHDDRVL